MMLKRKIEKDILHWIEDSDKALLVYGVRQAGKRERIARIAGNKEDGVKSQ